MTTKSSKPKDYSRLDNTTTHWYVMLHRNPHLLDLMLKRENASSCSDQGDMRQIEYFIPYCFLSRVHETGDKTVTEGIDFSNQLREDFHDFAFFHTTERGIAMLLDREWNSNLRYHLRHFRDVRKNPVVISDAEMNTLIRVFSERKLRYTIGLPGVIIGAIQGPQKEIVYGYATGSADTVAIRPIVVTRNEQKMLDAFDQIVSLDVNKKEGYLTLTVKGLEPIQTAELAIKAQ